MRPILAFAYLIARGIQTEDNPAFDYCSKVPLLPDSILGFISFDQIEFLKLTEYRLWNKEKQPA